MKNSSIINTTVTDVKEETHLYDDQLNTDEKLDKNSKLYYTNSKNPKFSLCKQWIYILIHSTMGFYFGYAMTALNNLGTPIFSSMGVEEKDQINIKGNVSYCFGIAKLIASQIVGSYAHKIGRKNMLVINEIFNIASMIQIFFIKDSVWYFYAQRSLVGVYLGVGTVQSPRMLLECFPSKTKGLASGFFGGSIGIGVAVSYSLGQIFGGHLKNIWEYCQLAPAVITLLRLLMIIVFFNFDTPVQYAQKASNIDEIKEKVLYVCEQFYQKNDEITNQIEYLDNRIENNDLVPTSFFKLLKTTFCNKDTKYSQAAVQIYSVFGQVCPACMTDIFTVDLFKRLSEKSITDADPSFGIEVNFYSGIAILILSPLTGLAIECIGRRKYILYGQFSLLIAMLSVVIGFYFGDKWISFTGFIILNSLTYFNWSGLYYTYMNEISEVFVVSIGVSFVWLSKSILQKVLIYVINNQELFWTPLLLFLVGSLLYIIAFPLYLETKGKTSIQIKEEYKELRYWGSKKNYKSVYLKQINGQNM